MPTGVASLNQRFSFAVYANEYFGYVFFFRVKVVTYNFEIVVSLLRTRDISAMNSLSFRIAAFATSNLSSNGLRQCRSLRS